MSPTYNDKTEDDLGRQIKPIVTNTAKDGSGTPLFAITDADGHAQTDVLSITAGTNVIGKVDSPITAPTSYNITCTDADTEYSQALPTNCRFFEFQCRTENATRYAFETGKVATPTAPYHTLKAGDYYNSPQIAQAAAPSTLYVASATAGVVIELLVWT